MGKRFSATAESGCRYWIWKFLLDILWGIPRVGKNVWRIEDIFFLFVQDARSIRWRIDQRRIFDTFQRSFAGDTIGHSQFPLGFRIYYLKSLIFIFSGWRCSHFRNFLVKIFLKNFRGIVCFEHLLSILPRSFFK